MILFEDALPDGLRRLVLFDGQDKDDPGRRLAASSADHILWCRIFPLHPGTRPVRL